MPNNIEILQQWPHNTGSLKKLNREEKAFNRTMSCITRHTISPTAPIPKGMVEIHMLVQNYTGHIGTGNSIFDQWSFSKHYYNTRVCIAFYLDFKHGII